MCLFFFFPFSSGSQTFFLCWKYIYLTYFWASQVALVVKNPPVNAGDLRYMGSIPGLGRSPGGRAWQPIPVFLPGESCGQRSLASHGQ